MCDLTSYVHWRELRSITSVLLELKNVASFPLFKLSSSVVAKYSRSRLDLTYVLVLPHIKWCELASHSIIIGVLVFSTCRTILAFVHKCVFTSLPFVGGIFVIILVHSRFLFSLIEQATPAQTLYRTIIRTCTHFYIRWWSRQEKHVVIEEDLWQGPALGYPLFYFPVFRFGVPVNIICLSALDLISQSFYRTWRKRWRCKIVQWLILLEQDSERRALQWFDRNWFSPLYIR